MLNRFRFLLKAGVGIAGCVAAIGAAQATPLTAVDGDKFSTNWQNIASASYTFNDANHDGKLSAGEVLTFTIEMDKLYWGKHAFDALKVWIGNEVYTGQWNFSTSASRGNESYTHMLYNLPNKFFSFNYTATQVGPLDIYASVMCNSDLTGLVADGSGANPSQADWNAWTYGIKRVQGEDKHYIVPVPEPKTYAMLLVGLGLLAFTARRRKDFTA